MRKCYLLVVLFLLSHVSIIYANATVQYVLGVDDYGELWIDGELEAFEPDYGGAWTEVLSLSPGWHDIEIVFKNNAGTSWVSLQTYDLGTDTYATVPLENFRSLDEQDSIISGLKAEYYTLDDVLLKTIYGEGPIVHVSGEAGSDRAKYQEVEGEYWMDYSALFRENLSGEIYVSAATVPAPGALLLGSMGVGFVGWLRRRRTI